MAQLAGSQQQDRWTARQTEAQYRAIAWLRWRIWVNGFRRKGNRGELVGRIFTITLGLLLLIGPTLAAGVGAWYFASQGELKRLAFLLWGIFALSQLLNINLGRPGTTFDPTELIRFPMRLRHYVCVRMFFGLLAPANIQVVTTSIAVAVGVIIALPAAWLITLLAMLVFAAGNVFFTRMVFAWVDRWMSTRRAREIFTLVIFTASLGFQYVNATFNPAYSHHRHLNSRKIAVAQKLYHRADPFISLLPPGLTVLAVVSAADGQPVRATTAIAGCATYAVFFLSVFALRARTEFRGENLSDTAHAVAPRYLSSRPSHAHVQVAPAETKREASAFGLSSTVLTVFGKEFLYLRRNTGLFYGLIAPAVMMFLFAGRLAARASGTWLYPTALAYALMGIAPLSYNSFGLEGAGTQFYFLAPIRLRDVFIGKNLMGLFLGSVEIVAVFAILSYVATRPTIEVSAIGICWAIGTMLLNTSIGNLRSVSAPKKISLDRTANKQASPLSALMSLGILIVAAGFAAGLLVIGRVFAITWIVLPIMVAYAAAGFAIYLANLRAIDRFALAHREALFEELCKK